MASEESIIYWVTIQPSPFTDGEAEAQRCDMTGS